MRIDEMTPESTEDEMSAEMADIIGRLRSGLISKDDAFGMMKDMQDDLMTRRALLDRSPEGTMVFLRIGLMMKMVTKFIDDHP